MAAHRGRGRGRAPGRSAGAAPGSGAETATRPRRRLARRDRRLSVAEAQFYARVYGSARKGSLAELRRRGATESEAEEVFAAAYARVMESVDPIAREFTAPQMVSFVKRACWRWLIEERRRGAMRAELEACGLGSRPESGAEAPQELAEEREAVAIGREALALLPERDRAVFSRRHQLGMTPEEIVGETPGLSMRTYRKILQRANARVLEAFAQIEIGERCAEMEAALLRRYLAGETSTPERRAVEAHLAHCRACQQAGARMRGYLIDVAGGALLASSLGAPGSAVATQSAPARLLELASQGLRLLGEASRAGRERLREALLRAPALPGSGTDAGAAQALGTTSVRIASLCTAGIAAGACVAAGVVPGIGAVGSSAHHHPRPSPPARQARAVSAPVPGGVGESAPPATSEGGSGGAGASAPARSGAAKTKAGAPSVSSAKPSGSREASPASARASGRQTGTEFGIESTQAPTPSAPPPPSSPAQGASGGSLSSGASARGSGSGAAGGSGSKSAGGSGSEFGM